MSEQFDPFRYPLLLALLLSFCLAVAYISLIVGIDNTNLQTTNGLWKTPSVYSWEHGTGRPLDSGGFLYFPAYGYLSRLIPDRFVSYGIHGDVVTYRKLAVLNAAFGAIASGAVFLLVLRLTESMIASFIASFAHASSAFILLNSLNSEDVIPAYTFFVICIALLLEYWVSRKVFFLLLAAPFAALVTLFHWTLMIPCAAGICAVEVYEVVQQKRLPWSGIAFLPIFVATIKLALFMISLPTSQVFSFWQIIYPSKAGASGWLGIRWEKIHYAFIGVGNYFCGGFNVGDYHGFATAHPNTLFFSYFYLISTSLACAWALWSRSAETKIKQMAIFAVTLFLIGELEHLYAQPSDPQSQIQPMFITVVGLAILLRTLTGSDLADAFRWMAIGLFALFAANGAANLDLMFLAQGGDSQSVKAVKEFAELFPPANTLVITQGFEGWNTWLFVEVYHGDSTRYLSSDVELTSTFVDHGGISGIDAADLTKKRIDKAFDEGYRVVADTLWTGDPDRFAESMEEVTDIKQARTYYGFLRPAFEVGRDWDTPYGRFVELHSQTKHF